jgi:hypothetical protein
MKFMVHVDTKRGFTGFLKSTQTWKILVLMTARNQKKVYKYDDRDELSDSDDSQESSPRPARVSDVTHLQERLTSVRRSSYGVYDNNSVS